MDMHFANANAPQWETNIKNKPTEAKRSRRVEARKVFVPPPCTASSGRRGRRSFGCHAEEDGMETCWLMEIIWPGAAWLFIFSCASEEAACLWSDGVRKVSSKFAERGWDATAWKNVNQWKGRVVSSSPVVSGLCSNMIEIWEPMMMSSG